MKKKALEIIFVSYPRGDIYFLLIHTMKSLFDLFFPPYQATSYWYDSKVS